MSLYENFCNEVDTQEGIIKYLEVYCFEEEYNRVSHLFEEPVRPLGDVYSENVEFISELKSRCSDLRDNISVSYSEEVEWPDWADNIDYREPIGELIEYCIETLESGENLEFDIIKSEIDVCNCEAEEIIYTDEDIQKAILIAPLCFASKSLDIAIRFFALL